ncbi:ankyrin repeat-containing domain protein [Pestalotiopsis sp. NC0098]|nr:ankyrin repeat-containing domain protein [Pestalotiopsis sp. NC0098]
MQNAFGKPSEILHAAVRDGDVDRLWLLLSEESTQTLLRHTNHAWGTPLHVAVWYTDVQALRLLLCAGPDTLLEWDQNDSDMTPIQLAAVRGDESILSALWDAIVDRTHVSGPGSCLISACAYGKADIVTWLLTAWDGWAAGVTSRALAAAVQQWHTQVVEVLLQHVEYTQAFRYEMLEKACGPKPMPDPRGMPKYEQADQDDATETR